MRLNYLTVCLPLIFSLSTFAQWGSQEYNEGDVISNNATGVQGDYHIEYWKDNGSGSMTLGEDCGFSCQWGQVGNILFRKGIRPGGRDLIVSYEADYQPQGNSYLSIYGWFENPLVEYYIIESWGSWKPPGVQKKSSFENEEGTYDIFQNSRTGPSIKGNTTFQQYWSVRTAKRTSGIITVGDHFAAWEDAGMQIGTFYEVSFNVEAYQSPGGKAEVTVVMMTEEEYLSTGVKRDAAFNRSGTAAIPMLNNHTPATFYNVLGQKMTGMSGRVRFQGPNSVQLHPVNGASGVYYSIPEQR